MDKDFIEILKDKELELVLQLESLRKTIALFSSNTHPVFVDQTTKVLLPTTAFNPVYDKKMSWNSKILFVLKQLGEGFVSDIFDYIIKEEPEIDKDFLNKRLTATASALKTNGTLDGKPYGRKLKYFIKEKV